MRVFMMVYRFLQNDSGAVLVEYVLIGVFVSIIAVFAITTVGGKIAQDFLDVIPGLQ